MNGIILYLNDLQKSLEMKELFENRCGYPFKILRLDSSNITLECYSYVVAEWNLKLQVIIYVRNK